MKIIGLIQARMGSSRLPGKVMMPLVNKPLLWHILQRIKKVKLISEIILATSFDKDNDILENFANKNGIICHRFEIENDLISRIYSVSKKIDYDIMVKVNADCPLIDFNYINDLLSIFVNRKLDFASNKLSKTFPLGYSFEILNKEIIKYCNDTLETKSDRELVIKWIMDNKKKFKTGTIFSKKNLSKYDLTLDTQEDYDLISSIFENLYYKSEFFGMNSVIKYLEKNNNKITKHF